MEISKKLQQISCFLAPYEKFYSHEILYQYPNHLDLCPASWWKDVQDLGLEEIAILDAEKRFDFLPNGELRNFLEEVNALCELENISSLQSVHDQNFIKEKLTEKKQHELQRLIPYMDKLAKKKNLKGLVDLAGGMGHLAFLANYHFNYDAISIDFDERLQKRGIKRNERYQSPQLVKYIHSDLFKDDWKSEIDDTSRYFVTSLHACGGLSSDIFRTMRSKNFPLFVNFGCCYYKSAPEDFHLSELSKNYPLKLNKDALVLATRSHHGEKMKNFEHKFEVKKRRYLLHYFLFDMFGRGDLQKFGSSNKHIYQMNFSDYVHYQLNRCQVNLELPCNEDIDKFYLDQKNQNVFMDMLRLGAIRSYFGRAIEVYINLDRAQFLIESGRDVDLKEVFDPKISPRNIGIFAQT